MQKTWVQSLGWEDPLDKGMATHSSVLAWRTPWTEEPGGLQSMWSQSRTQLRDWFWFPGGASGKESACQYRRRKIFRINPWVGTIPWSRKWYPTPESCLKTSMERGVWGATVSGAMKNQTRLRLSTHRRGMRLRLINRIRDGQTPVPSLIRSMGAETFPSHSHWGTSQSAWLWWMVMKMTAVVLGAGLLCKRTMCQALC